MRESDVGIALANLGWSLFLYLPSPGVRDDMRGGTETGRSPGRDLAPCVGKKRMTTTTTFGVHDLGPMVTVHLRHNAPVHLP